MCWRIRLEKDVPATGEADLMDWTLTSPQPQNPEISLYPDNYVPGGWFEEPPTPSFARRRPFEFDIELRPAEWSDNAKRVCLGLGRAGAARVAATVSSGADATFQAGKKAAKSTADATISAGFLAAVHTIDGLEVATKTVRKSTTSLVRKFNRERPRDRAIGNHGNVYERTRGYSSPRFNRMRTVGGEPSFDEIEETARQAEMQERIAKERIRLDERLRLTKRYPRAPWQNPYEEWSPHKKAAGYLRYLEQNPEVAAKVSPGKIEHNRLLAAFEQDEPVLVQYISVNKKFKRVHKRGTNKIGYTLPKFKKLLATHTMQPTKPFKPSTHANEDLSEIHSPPKIALPSTPAQTTPIARPREQDITTASNDDHLDAPDTPTPPPQFPTTTHIAAEDEGDVHVADTPTTTGRRQIHYDLPERTPQRSPGYWARLDALLFGTPPQAEGTKQAEQVDQEELDAGETQHPSEQQGNGLDAGKKEDHIKTESANDLTQEDDEPSLPGTPSSSYSDISSTCDIDPSPYQWKHISLPHDALASSATSLPPATESTATTHELSNVVAKTPGAWVEETADDENKNDELRQPSTGPIARRTRSMQIRIKEDSRTPQKDAKTEAKTEPKTPAAKTEKAAAEKTPPRTAKTAKHGTTKKKAATEAEGKRERHRRAAEQWKITGLTEEWIKKVESAVKHGDKRSGLKASDFSRVAPFRTYGASNENWLNDETINEYLKIVSTQGEEATIQKATQEGRSPPATKSHHAFNSFFYTTLVDPAKGVSTVKKWSKRAKVDGRKLLDTKFVFIPINSAAHWTLAVVSGTNRTITYYDSLGGRGGKKMEEILRWVEAELGSDFVRSEWQLLDGMSGRQTNSDDCGVFTVTNARSLMLGEEPEKSFGPDKVRFQRERIVAEIVNGALLPRGS